MNDLVKLRAWFLVSVGLLLFLTSAAKFVALTQHKPFLAGEDPLFTFLATRQTLAIAATLELAVAGWMFARRRQCVTLLVCSWLVYVFICYRSLSKVGFGARTCPCLGGVLDWTGISPSILNAIPVVMLWYMGVGSLMFLAASLCASHRLQHAITHPGELGSDPSRTSGISSC